MRYVFRFPALVATLGILGLWSVTSAQVALDELDDAARKKANENLVKEGARESHQGADNPRQGSRSDRPGPFGGPDPYGPESAKTILEKAETKFNDPQWQLKIDLQNPKRLVVEMPDGTAKEYWYVMFRVINDNTRRVKRTTPPNIHGERVDIHRPVDPLETRGGMTNDMEGVPVDAHLDFEFHVFTRDIERDPWDTDWPRDPEDDLLSPEALAARRANMKRVYRPVSNHYVLQRVAEAEGMYEWMGNYDYINEPVMLLHPLSDFQRQAGFAHNLTAPEYGGPRCLAYRFSTVDGEVITESLRYVAVYNDNTFAGLYGQGDSLPDGARLVDNTADPMWGKLTTRRYRAGDCIDRYGRPLRANDPGYLNARIAGGRSQEQRSYGVIAADHPAIGRPVRVPHVRMYKTGDRVLFDHNTTITHDEAPNRNHVENGRIVLPSDPRYEDAREINETTRQFGGAVVGRPVKMLDQRGRPIRRYIVTYQAGDILTQAEWDIYRRRLGRGILARYDNLGDIVGRPLTDDDPVVGLPKIRMGHFVGDDGKRGETINRGIDTGRRGPEGEVILEAREGFVTGRSFDARRVDPSDFRRDPDGTFTTNREAPLPPNHGLKAGEEYIYAPLGNPREGAAPVPAFDELGAWKDYRDPLSNQRIPLYDEDGELIRDMQDQILYLKEYEYEYVYMYEYERTMENDQGFSSTHGGESWKLVEDDVEYTRTPDGAGGHLILPLVRLIHEEQTITEPEIVDGVQITGADGNVVTVTKEEFEAMDVPEGATIARVKLLRLSETKRKVVVGVYEDGKRLQPGQTGETWEQARQRAREGGAEVVTRRTLRFVNRYRMDHAAKDRESRIEGDGPREDEFESNDVRVVPVDFEQLYKGWNRWTVPPPLVFMERRDGRDEWRVITRLAQGVGPATRHDGMDMPRFLRRHVSEMWGVAIFEGVARDWDWANVYVRGLRGHISHAGLKRDMGVRELPGLGGDQPVERAFFKPRMVGQEWVYRVRYERLGDEFENYRDLIRPIRNFWYKDQSGEYREYELDN